MRARREKGADALGGEQVIDPVAGADHRVHGAGHAQTAHVLMGELGAHALAPQPLRRHAQHAFGDVHAHHARALPRQFHGHPPRAAARIHEAFRLHAGAAQQRAVILCPFRMIEIIGEEIVDGAERVVALHRYTTPLQYFTT